MIFLPYEQFVIMTNKTANDVLSIMKNHVAPIPKGYSLFFPSESKDFTGKEFYGTVGLESFGIVPIPTFTYSKTPFVPMIEGLVKDNQVDVKMKPNKITKVFIAISIVICLLLLIVPTNNSLDVVAIGKISMRVVLYVILVLDYCLLCFQFRSAAVKSRKILMKLLGM